MAPLFSIDLTNSTYLEVKSTWGARNVGSVEGIVGLKVNLVQTRGLQVDRDWFQWTPLEREGGPGFTKDFFAENTSFRSFVVLGDSTMIRSAGPGETATIISRIRMAGPSWAGLTDFWKSHSRATFKLVLELIHIDASSGFISSIGSATADEFMQIFTNSDGGGAGDFQFIGDAMVQAVAVP